MGNEVYPTILGDYSNQLPISAGGGKTCVSIWSSLIFSTAFGKVAAQAFCGEIIDNIMNYGKSRWNVKGENARPEIHRATIDKYAGCLTHAHAVVMTMDYNALPWKRRLHLEEF